MKHTFGRPWLCAVLAAASGRRVDGVSDLVTLVRDASTSLRMTPPSMGAAATALEQARRLLETS